MDDKTYCPDKWFVASCEFEYNSDLSGPDKSVFTCECGNTKVEPEDAGTGA